MPSEQVLCIEHILPSSINLFTDYLLPTVHKKVLFEL